jgi:DNA-binding beta-propeller fold protein YncE
VKSVEAAPRALGRAMSAGAPAVLALALLVIVVPAGAGCRRGEAPGAPGAASAAVTPEASAPKEPLEASAPQIRESPSPDRPPWAGMKEPRDAAVDSRGRIWIADFGNSRLRVFDGNGGYLGGLGNRGNGNYELRDPCAVAIRGDDVYIADTWNGRVQAYSITGEWKATAAGLFGPRGVAAGPDGKVWVTDTGNNRLAVYDRTLANPEMIGKPGSGPAEFQGPVGIAVDASGAVYVADTRNKRVEVLASNGKFRRSVPVPGWEGSPEPHVEVGDAGRIYVSDPNAAKVLEVDAGGRLARSWTADDTGKAFARPMGLAIDRKGKVLYVVDAAANSVSKVSLEAAKK